MTINIRSLFILLSVAVITFSSTLIVDAATNADIDAVYDTTTFYDESLRCEQNRVQANPNGATVNGTVADFINTYGQSAFDIGRLNGIPYEVILAQAAHESGWGTSGLTVNANNFFGIKAGDSWEGEIYEARTREEDANGNSFYVIAEFRAYASPLESFLDHAQFLRRNSRNYGDAFAFPNDPIAFLERLVDRDEPGENAYATDLAYATNVGQTIRNIQAYIADQGLWPPSSEVEYEVQPLEGADNSTVSSTSTGCSLVTAQNIEFTPFSSFEGRLMDRVDAIVLHYTAGRYNSPEQFVSAIQSNPFCDGGCSVQLFIDAEGEVYQMVDDLRTVTAHACGVNHRAIGIEIEGLDEADLERNNVQRQAVVNTVVRLQELYPSVNIFETNSDEIGGLYGHLETDQWFCGGRYGSIDPGADYLENVREAVRSIVNAQSLN